MTARRRLVEGVAWVRDEDRLLVLRRPGCGPPQAAVELAGAEALAWELWAEGRPPAEVLELLCRWRGLAREDAVATWRRLVAALERHGLLEPDGAGAT